MPPERVDVYFWLSHVEPPHPPALVGIGFTLDYPGGDFPFRLSARAAPTANDAVNWRRFGEIEQKEAGGEGFKLYGIGRWRAPEVAEASGRVREIETAAFRLRLDDAVGLIRRACLFDRVMPAFGGRVPYHVRKLLEGQCKRAADPQAAEDVRAVTAVALMAALESPNRPGAA